jgi:hypothetical protein
MDDIREFFARRQEQVERLLERFETTPEVVVHGVVDAAGISGGMAEGESRWSLSGELAPWRIAEGAIEDAPLNLRRLLSDDELDEWRELDAYAVIAVRARVIVDPDLGPQARIESLIGAIEDEELAARADDLQEPVVFDDARLGACTFDRSMGWFTSETPWGDRTVTVHLAAPDLDALPEALRPAHALFEAQAEWDARARAYAAAQLLALKNEEWREEDETPVTADQFIARLSLRSMTVDRDGAFTFYFGDDDLFWGHSILVGGTIAGGPTDADIAG